MTGTEFKIQIHITNSSKIIINTIFREMNTLLCFLICVQKMKDVMQDRIILLFRFCYYFWYIIDAVSAVRAMEDL
jgi:hypothetical protein